jgi:hypothetical protein
MKFIVLARKSKMSAASFPSAGKLGLTSADFPEIFSYETVLLLDSLAQPLRKFS